MQTKETSEMSEPVAVAAASSPQVPLIRVASVTKRFGGVQALRGVNLEPYRKPPVAVVKINFIEPNQQ